MDGIAKDYFVKIGQGMFERFMTSSSIKGYEPFTLNMQGSINMNTPLTHSTKLNPSDSLCQSASAQLSESDWLCLSFLTGIGPARLSRLFTYLSELDTKSTASGELESFETSPLFEEDPSGAISYELLRALKWPEVTAREAMAYLSRGELNDEQKQKCDVTQAWLEKASCQLVLQDDVLYPESLKEISVSPAFLYVEGDPKALSLPKIGIVGARKCTRYGREATLQFAEQLAAQGVCVVSGGALGIDTAAHEGALKSNTTPTIAVMGTGLQHRYPHKNTTLFEQILHQGGALVSEYPLMTGPKPHLFPPRNRIISGLSMGVLVSEASIKSGSLISASYAIQQNREVFALPGRLSDSQSEGCHQLLRQGATLVRHVDDILAECDAAIMATTHDEKKKPRSESSKKNNEVMRSKSKAHKETKADATVSILKKQEKHPLPDGLSSDAKAVATLLEKEIDPMDFDALIRHSKMNAGDMMQVLMELELAECIENREGLYGRC